MSKTEEQKEKNRIRARRHYEKVKDDPEFKAKNRARVAQWREDNPDKLQEHSEKKKEDWHALPTEVRQQLSFANHLKGTYGITPQEHDELMARANNSCEICGKHQSKERKKLNVDHCHVTGKIRGILCTRCNSAIATLGDNEEGVQRAVDYLRERG